MKNYEKIIELIKENKEIAENLFMFQEFREDVSLWTGEDEDNFDSIVSIGEVAEHPSIMKQIVSENNILPFCKELELTTRRQDNKKAYFPYGVAYIVKTKSLLEEKTFYTARNTFYEIKRYQCYEIDDIYDFLAIENIMKYEWSLK